jgi:hypothetical protein
MASPSALPSQDGSSLPLMQRLVASALWHLMALPETQSLAVEAGALGSLLTLYVTPRNVRARDLARQALRRCTADADVLRRLCEEAAAANVQLEWLTAAAVAEEGKHSAQHAQHVEASPGNGGGSGGEGPGEVSTPASTEEPGSSVQSGLDEVRLNTSAAAAAAESSQEEEGSSCSELTEGVEAAIDPEESHAIDPDGSHAIDPDGSHANAVSHIEGMSSVDATPEDAEPQPSVAARATAAELEQQGGSPSAPDLVDEGQGIATGPLPCPSHEEHSGERRGAGAPCHEEHSGERRGAGAPCHEEHSGERGGAGAPCILAGKPSQAAEHAAGVEEENVPA